MKIRKYESSDHDAVWELHNIGLNQTGTNLGNGKWDDDLHHVEQVYLQNDGEFLVGLVDNQLIAMGALKKTSSILAEIKRMRVHPDYQGKGYGLKIYKSLETKANALGYKKLHLDTTSKQLPAQRLYEKLGFKEVSRQTLKDMELIFYEKIIGD